MSEEKHDTAAEDLEAKGAPAAAAASASNAEEAAAPAPQAIDFDRAEFEEPKGEHVECGLCHRTIHTEYWQALGKILCASCRNAMNQASAQAGSGKAFGKAFLLGGGVALGCGIGYAIFVGVTHIQFALVTIGIGWAVGTTIQKVTRGLGSRKHQVLAVALTYFAATMSYFPGIVQELRSMGSQHESAAAPGAALPAIAPADSPADSPAADAPSPAPDAAERPAKSGGVGIAASLLLLTVLCVALTLAAPFLALAGGSTVSGLLGLLIIFFGLNTAWKISRGVQATITGPHRVDAA